MKKLMVFLVLMSCSCFLNAQVDFEKESIRILPDSELIIAGSTNVNKFDYEFDIDLLCESKEIRYMKDENVLNFTDLQINLALQAFDCGNSRMNADFQDLLLCEKYPEIKIDIKTIELLPGEYTKAYIQVQLAGKTKEYSLPVQVNNDRFTGKFKINIRDFGLEPPKKALGLIEVDELIEVQFNLKVEI